MGSEVSDAKIPKATLRMAMARTSQKANLRVKVINHSHISIDSEQVTNGQGQLLIHGKAVVIDEDRSRVAELGMIRRRNTVSPSVDRILNEREELLDTHGVIEVAGDGLPGLLVDHRNDLSFAYRETNREEPLGKAFARRSLHHDLVLRGTARLPYRHVATQLVGLVRSGRRAARQQRRRDGDAKHCRHVVLPFCAYSFGFFARGAAFAALAAVARFAAFAALRGCAGAFAVPPAAAFSFLRAFASARARCSALRFTAAR